MSTALETCSALARLTTTRVVDADGKQVRAPGRARDDPLLGSHQRFFRGLCMVMKCPQVVEIARRALAADKSVAIGLQTTGESRLNDALAEGMDLDEFAGMKEIVRFLVGKRRRATTRARSRRRWPTSSTRRTRGRRRRGGEEGEEGEAEGGGASAAADDALIGARRPRRALA